jgi:hypothetical protein
MLHETSHPTDFQHKCAEIQPLIFKLLLRIKIKKMNLKVYFLIPKATFLKGIVSSSCLFSVEHMHFLYNKELYHFS